MLVTLEEAKTLVESYVAEKVNLLKNEVMLNLGDPNLFRIQVAGKNFSNFDSVVLKQNGFDKMFNYCSHRFIDVGSMYMEDFGFVPSSGQIAKKINIKTGNHRALEDAKMVAQMIEHKIAKKTSNAFSKAPVFRPYISMDIETTGLTECNPYILEIGIYFEDYGYFGLEEKDKCFRLLIDNGELDQERCQPIAMDMNEELLVEISNRKRKIE